MSAFRSNVYVVSLTERLGIGCTIDASGAITAVTGPTIQRVAADPNGVETANAGSLALQTDSTVWVNTDSGTTWIPLGGGGGSGWKLPDNVVGIWGTTSPNQARSVYVSASRRFDLLTTAVSQATLLSSVAIQIATGSDTITGAVLGGASGLLQLLTGNTDCTNAGGTGGDTGAMQIGTGGAASTLGVSGNSGSLSIFTGSSADANSGGISIQTGGVTGGVRGSITLNAQAVNVTSPLTTTDGVTGGTVRVVGGRAFVTTANSATVTNTTVETAFSTGAYTIAGNTLKVGTQVRVRLWGTVPSGNAMDTLVIALRFGAAGVAAQIVTQTAAVDVTDGGGDTFVVDTVISIRTTGAGGTMVASSFWQLGVPDTATTRADRMASAAIDTTIPRDLTATARWSAASTADQVVLEGMTVWVD